MYNEDAGYEHIIVRRTKGSDYVATLATKGLAEEDIDDVFPTCQSTLNCSRIDRHDFARLYEIAFGKKYSAVTKPNESGGELGGLRS